MEWAAGLFGTKVEKALAKVKKKDLTLLVRYLDGNQDHPCKLVRVDRDKFLITGFTESLREDTVVISVKELGISFNSKITHKTHDIRGNLLYYCSMPDDLEPLRPHTDRFFVYPKAVITLSVSSLEELIDEHEEVKTIKMYVWDVTDLGMDLVNSKAHRFENGRSFDTCKITVGKLEVMVSLEVTGLSTKEYGKERLNIVQVKFVGSVDNKAELMDLCRRIDSM